MRAGGSRGQEAPGRAPGCVRSSPPTWVPLSLRSSHRLPRQRFLSRAPGGVGLFSPAGSSLHKTAPRAEAEAACGQRCSRRASTEGAPPEQVLPRPPRYLHPVNLGNSERSGRETSRNTGCLSCSATSKALLGWEMTVAPDPSHTPEPRPHHLAQAAQPGAAGGAVMVPMSQMGKLRPGAISEPRFTLELKLFFCLFF